jgi:uncharacterized protein YndB with AHSA1/START domain
MSDSQTVLRAEAGRHDITMARRFDAPRDLVFRVYTDPVHVPQWWGPKYLVTTVDVMEARRGGSWRFVQRAPDGSVHAFRGVYHDVVAPERIVNTFEFEGVPFHVVLETTTLTAVDAGTLLTTRSIYDSVEDRDAVVATGMEAGATETMDRLAALLAGMEES